MAVALDVYVAYTYSSMSETWLRKRRLAMGMTQRDLAGELGVSLNTLARWERGELEVQHPQMLSLALDAVRSQWEGAGRAQD